MKEKLKIKNLITSLIDSIDMYNYLLRDHHRRTAIIAYQLGVNYGLDKHSLSRLVLAASIHDIGALHITERDQLLEEDVLNPRKHELVGAQMVEGFKPFNNIRDIINHHHIRYDDFLYGDIDDEVPFECFVLHLADRIDVLATTMPETINKRELIIEKINKKFNSVFHPTFKPIFNDLVFRESFWDNLDNTLLHGLVLESLYYTEYEISCDDVFDLAEVFSRIVDYKSTWTSKHSLHVSLTAGKIAELMHLSEENVEKLRIAGYLHDIGKIAVPTEILEKKEPLTALEKVVMRSHAMYSSIILSQIECLGDIARWASSHHERRDNSGYPLHINSTMFSIEMDIIAYSDIFVALTENRPYRRCLNREEMLVELEKEAMGRLSQDVYEVITSHFDELHALAS